MSKNPFLGATPADLLVMVQEGVKCKRCYGGSNCVDCPTCSGTGHAPLSNSDLDALVAKWCEGREVEYGEYSLKWFCRDSAEGYGHLVPRYTTDPVTAMRLMVKYEVDVQWLYGYNPVKTFLNVQGSHDLGLEMTDVTTMIPEEKSAVICHAITEAALIAAMEAMEGGGDPGD